MNVIENIVMNERCNSYKPMWQLFVFTRYALQDMQISSVCNCMSHKCCNIYYSFPLIFGINFRYEPDYVQGHNDIDESFTVSYKHPYPHA